MIQVKLYGLPETIKDHNKIAFPFKKAEALFYYLCYSKRISRSKAIFMFWSDMPDQMARKSLRNAVYVIKKALKSDTIITSNREYIELDDSELEFLDEDLASPDWNNQFLHDFYVKDAEEFENWLSQIRQQVKERCIESLKSSIMSHLKNSEYAQADKLCKTLIRFDEYNEESYRIHMELYRQMGEHGKCIEIFSCLSRILETELSLKPDNQTRALFDSIMKERSKKVEAKTSETHFFYGRAKELQAVLDAINSFSNDRDAKSIWIDGEMGIGKSSIVNSILETINNYELCILHSADHCIEGGFTLSGWIKPVQVLLDLIKKHSMTIAEMDQLALASMFNKRLDVNNYRVVARAIANTIIQLSSKEKLLIILDNIHHFDEMSLSIVKDIIYRDQNKRVLILATVNSPVVKRVATLMAELKFNNLILHIELNRFSREESYEFMKRFKDYKNIDESRCQWIYSESDGNPLFITELLKMANHQHEIPSKMKDVFRYKISSLSDKGQRLLDIGSAFRQAFSFEALLKISGMNDFELISIIDKLIEKEIIMETCCGNDKDGLQFVHHKLKDFVYENQYKAKQKLIHKKIAEYYESLTAINYDEILYHYKLAGDKHNYLKFKIQAVFDYLEMAHEMFPIVKNGDIVTELLSQKGYKSDLKFALEEINNLYQDILNRDNQVGYELEIYHLNLMSRYYIISGKGDVGIQLIGKMIQLSMEKNNIPFILKGYKLLVYYYINTQKIDEMGNIIHRAIKMAHKHGYKEDLAVFIRLKGVFYIFNRDYLRGENYLKSALNFFKSLKDNEKYTLNIMACHYYMGESKRAQSQYSEAIMFYQQAIMLAERYGYVDRLTLFYSCLGQLYFDMGIFEESEKYLHKAIQLYEQFDFRWGRVLAWGYLALISCRKGELSSAKYCLEKAEHYQKVLNYHVDLNKLLEIQKKVIEWHI